MNRVLVTKTVLISFTLIILLSLSGCSLPGCWVFGFIWDACYDEAKAPCCNTDFTGSYTGRAFTQPAASPYYWGDRVELLIDPLLTSESNDPICLRTFGGGRLTIFRKTQNTVDYERVTKWKVKITCNQDAKKNRIVVPFNFQLIDFTSNEARLNGEGKLWLRGSLGRQIDLRFNDGAGLVEIQVQDEA